MAMSRKEKTISSSSYSDGEKRYWAIGFGEWVELREAVEKPELITSKVSRDTVKIISVPQWKTRYENGISIGEYISGYKHIKIPKTTKFTVSIYEGGKICASFSHSKFRRVVCSSLRRNGIMEISATNAQILMMNCD